MSRERLRIDAPKATDNNNGYMTIAPLRLTIRPRLNTGIDRLALADLDVSPESGPWSVTATRGGTGVTIASNAATALTGQAADSIQPLVLTLRNFSRRGPVSFFIDIDSPGTIDGGNALFTGAFPYGYDLSRPPGVLSGNRVATATGMYLIATLDAEPPAEVYEIAPFEPITLTEKAGAVAVFISLTPQGAIQNLAGNTSNVTVSALTGNLPLDPTVVYDIWAMAYVTLLYAPYSGLVSDTAGMQIQMNSVLNVENRMFPTHQSENFVFHGWNHQPNITGLTTYNVLAKLTNRTAYYLTFQAHRLEVVAIPK